MKLYFLTGNKHKYLEVKKALAKLRIEVEQINIDKPEIQATKIEDVAKHAAEKVAKELGKSVMVEDTGIFFEAYKNFPGVYSKFIYESIGYDGILKLLKGKNRKAYFKTVAAYCEPGKKPLVFKGISKGRIATKVYCLDQDVMPYDRVFIPEGTKKPWCLDLEHKHKVSHRKVAVEKLANYLKRKLNAKNI